MSADKHDLLARVTPPPMTILRGICKNDHPDTSADVIGPNAESVADFGCSPQALPNAELFTLAYDHALIGSALFSGKARLNLAVRSDIRGTVTPPSVSICTGPNHFWIYTVEAVDAAGCPVLTEELRAALRKAVGL